MVSTSVTVGLREDFPSRNKLFSERRWFNESVRRQMNGAADATAEIEGILVFVCRDFRRKQMPCQALPAR